MKTVAHYAQGEFCSAGAVPQQSGVSRISKAS